MMRRAAVRRIGIAAAIAVVIYGAALGVGALLYGTGAIATGATHNDCQNFRAQIASERGISEQDVPQQDIKQATEACLAGHTLTAREAFRSEYLLWSAWPAVVLALAFLAWPAWARILHNQEEAEGAGEAAGGRSETGMA